ncbi:Snaclec crotocetin-1 [Chionoecetes opilio]|uniref:Snaclec crotocetin-1 n=1 Tax=Chionoecetes opilio TaxID=41210 RepID=A0A8J4Y1I6_CHIOP|nr:Snaclec crotocetin-1 [Chionoecetes opilio]
MCQLDGGRAHHDPSPITHHSLDPEQYLFAMLPSELRWCAAVVLVVASVAAAQENLAARPRPVVDTQSVARKNGASGVVPPYGKRYGSSARNDVTRRYGGASPTTNGQTNGRTNGITGHNGHNVNDGHRMITRALWRIFDALMQKKDHSQLYGRMGFIEEALKKMISVDSQLEGEIDKLKDDMGICMTQLSTVMEELGRLKTLSSRLESLEQARPELRDQADQEQNAVWDSAAAAYSSCPSPFSRVGSECYYLSKGEMLGWEDARRECGRHGGDLASPRNLTVLRQFLSDVQDPPEYLWVGGSKQDDGAWKWTSGPQAGVPIDMSKSTWNEEVPSGYGKCMGLFGHRSYRAYNYDCKEKDFFVCQYSF